MFGFTSSARESFTKQMRRRHPMNNLPFEISIVDGVSEVEKFHRKQDKAKVKQFNDDVIAWSIYVTSLLKSNVRMLVKRDHILSDSIQPNIYYDRKYGQEVNRVGFSFAREGIYIHKGAGKGQGGYKGGSTWYNIHGQQKQTLTSSLMKQGTGNRQPIEWFDPVIERELSHLAEIVVNYSATLQLDTTAIFID